MAKIEQGDDVRVRLKFTPEPGGLPWVAFSGITEVNVNVTRKDAPTLDLLNGPNMAAQFDYGSVIGWSVASAEPDPLFSPLKRQ